MTENLIRVDDGTTFERTAKGHIELEIHLIAGARERFGLATQPHFGEWFMEFGREYSGAELPSQYAAMEPRMCFSNCFALAFFNEELRYCEGLAVRDDIPLLIHHAWCLDPQGRVVEPTFLKPSDSDSYFGFTFPEIEEVEKVVNETGTYSLLYKDEGIELIERIAGKVGSRG